MSSHRCWGGGECAFLLVKVPVPRELGGGQEADRGPRSMWGSSRQSTDRCHPEVTRPRHGTQGGPPSTESLSPFCLWAAMRSKEDTSWLSPTRTQRGFGCLVPPGCQVQLPVMQ